MNLPSIVKVGAWVYRIEPWETEASIGSGCSGECSTMAKLIRIRSSLPCKRAASALLHEIIHAVYYEWNMDQRDDQERVVSTLADGLSAVWHDNPGLMLWIGKGLAS